MNSCLALARPTELTDEDVSKTAPRRYNADIRRQEGDEDNQNLHAYMAQTCCFYYNSISISIQRMRNVSFWCQGFTFLHRTLKYSEDEFILNTGLKKTLIVRFSFCVCVPVVNSHHPPLYWTPDPSAQRWSPRLRTAAGQLTHRHGDVNTTWKTTLRLSLFN